MNKRLLFLAVAVVSSVTLSSAAPAPLPRPQRRGASEDDLQKMQGKWVRVKLGIGTPAREDNCPVTITGTRMQFPSPSDAWTLTLDTGRSPRTIDAKRVNGENSQFRGIY